MSGFGKPFKWPSVSARQKDGRPAPRNIALEQLLCEAIAGEVLVTLIYKRDGVNRTFQPSAVYHSTTGKVCVSGVQITNPAKPEDRLESHNFEIGLINQLSLTERAWIVNAPIDRLDKKYVKCIICP